MLKMDRVANLMESRLRRGEYSCREVPGEERLALEMCVSRFTARRALLLLEEKGLFHRQANGRLATPPEFQGRPSPQVLVVMPAWRDVARSAYVQSMHHAAEAEGVALWPLQYRHWEDPVLTEALSQVDSDVKPRTRGIVVVPPAEPMSLLIRQQLASSKVRMLITGRDLSPDGIVSLIDIAPDAMRLVLEHLYQVTAGPIDCFNSQPVDEEIAVRLQMFRHCTRSASRMGMIINEPAASFGDPIDQASRTAKRYLKDLGPQLDRGVLCLTEPAAIGLLRTARDMNIQVGDKLKVAALNDTGYCRHLSPSITCLQPPDTSAAFRKCFAWMRDATQWEDELLLRLGKPSLFVGESSTSVHSSQIALGTT